MARNSEKQITALLNFVVLLNYLHTSILIRIRMKHIIAVHKAGPGNSVEWRPIGNQEVGGSTPARSATLRFHDEIFSTVILSLPLIQERQLSTSGERMCTVLVNCLEATLVQ